MILNKKIMGFGALIFLIAFVSMGATNVMTNMPSNKTLNEKDNNNSSVKLSLSKLYDNHGSKFSIKYPLNWIYEDSGDGSVVFSGKKDTPTYFSTVNIQTILSKKSGGEYKSIQDIIADVKTQILKESPKTTFLDKGPFVLAMSNGLKLNGEFLTFIYSYQGHIIQQWQIVLPGKDDSVFYTWAYTAPIEQYVDVLPIAKAMLATWSIY